MSTRRLSVPSDIGSLDKGHVLDVLVEHTAGLLKATNQQRDDFAQLKRDLSAIRDGNSSGAKSDAEQAEREVKAAWRDIVLYDLAADTGDIPRLYVASNATTLAKLLSTEQPWTTWAYRSSYATFAGFVDQWQTTVSLDEVTIYCFDVTESNKTNLYASRGPSMRPELVWYRLRSRVGGERIMEQSPGKLQRTHSEKQDLDLVKRRTVKITNLTPALATICTASTPRFHIAAVPAFFNRYLSFTNFARVSLFNCSSKTKNSCAFEYHLAFYCVSPPQDALKVHGDPRGLRRAAIYSSDTEVAARVIHEEQLSYLYLGLGRDWGTCFQLFERYPGIPIPSRYEEPSDFVGPSELFFNWLTSALHHVSYRWGKALEAVDATIESPSDVVFGGENIGLLSDDPRFTRARKYFRALQVYKMFEEGLVKNIVTWEDFYRVFASHVNDGVITEDQLQLNLLHVEQIVDSLRTFLERVKAKAVEVERLQQGLFGASQLFDSRTAVRQGDNIRLLTYITILFLPLSFGTSIFGMQVILPNLPMKVFIITMPTIFVATFVIVFNLQNILNTAEATSQGVTKKLRERMSNHHSHAWRKTEQILREDKATQELPVPKANPRSTHWMYPLYIAQELLIQLPVHELQWFHRLLFQRSRTRDDFSERHQKDSRAVKVRARKLEEDEA